MRARRFWRIAALAGILAAAGVSGGVVCDAREGEVLPLFRVEDMEGQPVDLRSLAREKTVMLFFWNSHKAPAIREIKFLNDIYGYYELYGLEILAIEGSGKAPEEVREEISKLRTIGTEFSYRVIPDPGGRLSRLFRVEDLPETFILNRGGRLLFHFSGFGEEDAVRLEREIKEVLALLPAPEAEHPGVAPPPQSTERAPVPQRKGVTVDPEQQLFEKYRYFGNYYYNLGDMEKSLANYIRCLEIRPQSTEILLRVGEIQAGLRDYEKAREAWEKILDYDPDNSEADTLLRRLLRGEF